MNSSVGLLSRLATPSFEKDVGVLPPVSHYSDDHVRPIDAAMQTVHPCSAGHGSLLQSHCLNIEVLHRLLNFADIRLRRGEEDAFFSRFLSDVH